MTNSFSATYHSQHHTGYERDDEGDSKRVCRRVLMTTDSCKGGYTIHYRLLGKLNTRQASIDRYVREFLSTASSSFSSSTYTVKISSYPFVPVDNVNSHAAFHSIPCHSTWSTNYTHSTPHGHDDLPCGRSSSTSKQQPSQSR